MLGELWPLRAATTMQVLSILAHIGIHPRRPGRYTNIMPIYFDCARWQSPCLLPIWYSPSSFPALSTPTLRSGVDKHAIHLPASGWSGGAWLLCLNLRPLCFESYLQSGNSNPCLLCAFWALWPRITARLGFGIRNGALGTSSHPHLEGLGLAFHSSIIFPGVSKFGLDDNFFVTSLHWHSYAPTSNIRSLYKSIGISLSLGTPPTTFIPAAHLHLQLWSYLLLPSQSRFLPERHQLTVSPQPRLKILNRPLQMQISLNTWLMVAQSFPNTNISGRTPTITLDRKSVV